LENLVKFENEVIYLELAEVAEI